MQKRAFTLIELLIVVLIIAILAAIAIPNFMEFQTRAKVSRAKSDMRTMATGLEAYCADEGTYPATELVYLSLGNFMLGLNRLTTPIAYLTSIPSDPFGDRMYSGRKITAAYEYGAGKAGQYSSNFSRWPSDIWELESPGPDHDSDTGTLNPAGYATGSFPWVTYANNAQNRSSIIAMIYDPTNGTASSGQIFRAGGSPPPEPVMLWFQIVNR